MAITCRISHGSHRMTVDDGTQVPGLFMVFGAPFPATDMTFRFSSTKAQ